MIFVKKSKSEMEMKKSMTILYPVKKGLYINLTNRCPCACTFCLRQNDDSVYGSAPLWLEREPTVQEVIDNIKKTDLTKYEEIVFCGYGEPTERLYDLLEIAKYVKRNYEIKIRVNTNGLSDLIWGKNTAELFKGNVDVLSISMNATNAEDYLRMTRSKFGLQSFDVLLNFAKEAKEEGVDVVLTLVDTVTTKEEQKIALDICNSLGVNLRIRPLE